ncbi:MAG: DUF72 domain-containing protein [Nanoarchaeota archaeon]|nr:DUF72 domain-containing protein [Nanoarchaeota archaeon]
MKEYLIGTSGWNYEHWENRFYPKIISKKEWFNFYSKNFNTVEINYSFYRWPNEKTMKKWYKESPSSFKFTLKAPRTITHVKKLNNTEKWVNDFYKLASLLKEKLACILFQLPPSFNFNINNLNKLKKFLESLDLKIENVIEFRHASWWNKKVFILLKNKAIFCIVSSQEMPKDVVLTENTAYFRFHGINYSSDYSLNELKKYADKMKKLKCKKVYAYFNNDSNAYAVKNAKQLIKLVNE